MGSLGIAERMIRFFRVLIGNLPGGMGVVGTVVCLFWGTVSGSGPASVAAIGPLIIDSMEEDGYTRAFAAGLVCTGAALSIVIPPSIGLIIYGVIAEASIAKLFIAAIIPGFFMGMLMLLTLPFAKKIQTLRGSPNLARLSPNPYQELPSYGARLWQAFRDAFWGLLTPVVILGGIYSGIFTPTEAALVATVYALFVGGPIYHKLSFKLLYETLVDASRTSAFVMLVVAYASLFGWVVNVDNLIGQYSTLLLGISDNQWVILVVIMVILLIAGMFMDAVTIMFITLPIFMPVVNHLGWDPVWFGVILMINLAIGLITPPVGINLYVAANISRLPLEQVARGVLPFLVTALAGLAIVASFPSMSTFLVNLLAP